jgi:hypothetical protein
MIFCVHAGNRAIGIVYDDACVMSFPYPALTHFYSYVATHRSALFITAKVFIPNRPPSSGDVPPKNLHPTGSIQAFGFGGKLV